MTRQSEKNLLITVAALATTAIVVVVFSSSPTAQVQAPSRARRSNEAVDDGEEWQTVPDEVNDDNIGLFENLWDEIVGAEFAERNYDGDAALRAGGRKKKKNKNKGSKGGEAAKFNPNKVKAEHLAAFKPQMLEAFNEREASLESSNQLLGARPAAGDPSYAGEESDESYNFPGYARTAPVVQKFIDEFQCANNNYLKDSGNTNFYFLIPTTLPLFEDDPVGAYGNYMKFITKFAGSRFATGQENNKFRYSIGQFSNWVRFVAPKKYKNTGDFEKVNKKYVAPLMSAAQPSLFKSVASANSNIKESSAAAGNDCFLVWFFHDVPKDISEFADPSSTDALDALHGKCTVIPVMISPTTDKTQWRTFGAQFLTGRQLQYGKDQDYDGLFFADSVSGLASNNDLMEHLSNYVCLAKNRCLCRIRNDGYIYPPSEAAPTTGGTTTADSFRGVDDYEDNVVEDDAATTTAGTTTTEDAFATAAPTAKVPEIDSCCGHGAYTSIAYDSELKTCCDDGIPKGYMDDGSDPCA